MNVLDQLGKSFTCPRCGKAHSLPIRAVENCPGALGKLPALTEKLFGKGKEMLLVADDNTWQAAGEATAAQLSAAARVTPLVLKPKGEPKVSALEEYIPEIRDGAVGKDAIVTVGAGSITDLGKHTAGLLGMPVLSVGSAPSNNAYTSALAALLLSGGVKVTVPCPPAVAVVCDTDVMVKAPVDLVQSGFADSIAKAFANADWKFASFLGIGDDYCSLPLELVTEADNRYLSRGSAVAAREPEAVTALMDGLNMGGISMVIIGKSTPASGGEHHISHFLDMVAHRRGPSVFALHGLQVGVGCLILSKLWHRLRQMSRSEMEKRLAGKATDHAAGRALIEKKYFPFTGALVTEYDGKMKALEVMRAKLPDMWERILQDPARIPPEPKKLEGWLKAAGCACTYGELNIDPVLARDAVHTARYIRTRLTVLDLAGDLGLFEEMPELLG